MSKNKLKEVNKKIIKQKLKIVQCKKRFERNIERTELLEHKKYI